MIVNRIFLLLVGLMLAVLGAPFSLAQTNFMDRILNDSSYQPLDSPGSILHGRTKDVARWILNSLDYANRHNAEQAGNPIPERLTRFNQITNLIQLAPIESLSLVADTDEGYLLNNEDYLYDARDLDALKYYLFNLRVLRAGDLAGLVNLKGLGCNNLMIIEAGVFDGLPNLEVLHLHFSQAGPGGTLPAELFDPLANSLKDLRVGPGGTTLGESIFLCLRMRLIG